MSAQALVLALKNNELTLSCAESCTAGLVADAVASVPGASAVFCGALVCYTNQVKAEVLGVSEQTLAAYTAVSAEVALEMAQKCKTLFGTDCSISVTGVAGPKTDQDDAPVGTVYVGICTNKVAKTVKLQLEGDRAQIRKNAAKAAIEQLLCEFSQEA